MVWRCPNSDDKNKKIVILYIFRVIFRVLISFKILDDNKRFLHDVRLNSPVELLSLFPLYQHLFEQFVRSLKLSCIHSPNFFFF